MLAEFFPEFAEQLDQMDELYGDRRTIDEKTRQVDSIDMLPNGLDESASCVA